MTIAESHLPPPLAGDDENWRPNDDANNAKESHGTGEGSMIPTIESLKTSQSSGGGEGGGGLALYPAKGVLSPQHRWDVKNWPNIIETFFFRMLFDCYNFDYCGCCFVFYLPLPLKRMALDTTWYTRGHAIPWSSNESCQGILVAHDVAKRASLAPPPGKHTHTDQAEEAVPFLFTKLHMHNTSEPHLSVHGLPSAVYTRGIFLEQRTLGRVVHVCTAVKISCIDTSDR